LKVDGVADHKW